MKYDVTLRVLNLPENRKLINGKGHNVPTRVVVAELNSGSRFATQWK